MSADCGRTKSVGAYKTLVRVAKNAANRPQIFPNEQILLRFSPTESDLRCPPHSEVEVSRHPFFQSAGP